MNFTDILTEHRVEYHNQRPGWQNFLCPYCQKDPYMGYNQRGRYVHCWNCGRHPIWETVHIITGLGLQECFKLIDELPREIETWEKARPKGKTTLPPGLDEMGDQHKAYLRTRRFSPPLLRHQYDLRGLGIAAGQLKWRIWIPIYYRSETASWTTRAIGNKEPRYWAATDEQSAIPIENLLYGVDACRSAIILVEGPVDVWAVGPGAAAVMGLRTSPAQLEQISRFPLRVILFDSEDKAQERAAKLAADLSVFPGVTHQVTLENGKDAAECHTTEMGRSEIQALRKEFLA
jgi:hypothetical protein